MNFFKWIAGLLEDQVGSASSKRAVLYWDAGLITYMVIKHSGNIDKVNNEMFWGLIGVLLVFGGYATSEFFKSKQIQSNETTK